MIIFIICFILIICIISPCIFFFYVNKTSNEIIEKNKKYESMEIEFAKKREERVEEIVKKVSFKLRKLEYLNRTFSTFLNSEPKTYIFDDVLFFHNRKEFNNCNPYESAYKKCFNDAVFMKQEYNFYVHDYNRLLQKVLNIQTPDYVKKLSCLTIDDFNKYENKIFNNEYLKLRPISSPITLRVTLKYTSPKGRRRETLCYRYNDCDLFLDNEYKFKPVIFDLEPNLSYLNFFSDECKWLTYLYRQNSLGTKNIVTENGVKKIGFQEYKNVSDIKSVVFSKDVKIIGKEAFKHCLGLTKITILSDTITIEESAFECCLNLNEVIFSGSAIIKKDAFLGCYKINYRNIFKITE